MINYDVDSKQVPNHKLPPLRNPDILIGQNDLTALSYLNEPEGLNLNRFFSNSLRLTIFLSLLSIVQFGGSFSK